MIKSKQRLKVNNFYGVLFHNEKELLNISPKEFSNLVKSFKDNNITNKVGVSVYTLKSLNLIIKKFKLDLVQVPANIFDRRFLNQKLLQVLKEKKIKVFARSVFLKGVIINKKFRDKNKKLIRYKKEFDAYEKWVDKKNIINKKFFCINFVLTNKINNLVIGFDKFKEYKEISNYKNEKYEYPPHFITHQSDKNRILRPDLW